MKLFWLLVLVGCLMLQEVKGDAAAQYCVQAGGNVTQRVAAYNTNGPSSRYVILDSSADFCTFYAAPDESGFRSQISLTTATLYASGPTLAVVAYMEPVSMPNFTGANPATLYCEKLGGTAVWGGQNNGAGGGWIVTPAPTNPDIFEILDICVFPDGSAIDTWGLAYISQGVIRGTDLTKVVRYQTKNPPKIFFD